MDNLNDNNLEPDANSISFREHLMRPPAESWIEAEKTMHANIKKIKGSDPHHFTHKYDAIFETLTGKTISKTFKDKNLEENKHNGKKIRALWELRLITYSQMEVFYWLVDHLGEWEPFLKGTKNESKVIVSDAIKEMEKQKQEGTFRATPWQYIEDNKAKYCQGSTDIVKNQTSLLDFVGISAEPHK
jgi:hypothetical protein